MKKKLFIALLTTLLLLVAASAALADSPSNYVCTYCDVPCTRWVPVNSEGRSYHIPICDLCGNLWLEDLDRLLCTPLEGSATCTTPAVCSICGFVDYYGSAPDPNAHDISDSYYSGPETHYRDCLNGCYTRFDEGSHTGGTATCADYPTCTVCKKLYGNPDPNNHDWGAWVSDGNGTHIRTCAGNPGHTETANCTGGTATCTEQAVCTGCGQPYGEVDPNNHDLAWAQRSKHSIDYYHIKRCQCGVEDSTTLGEHIPMEYTCMKTTCKTCGLECFGGMGHTWSDWYMVNEERHQHKCQTIGCDVTYTPRHTFDSDADPTCDDCGYTREVHVHSGGTATCTEQAICEGCGQPYGEVDTDNHNWNDWTSNGNGIHTRTCANNSRHTETADCFGGDGSCMPNCEVCGGQYDDPNGQHRNICDWVIRDNVQHRRWCLDCNDYESMEFEDHYGGTATCTAEAICEGCGTAYGARSDVHPWGEWRSFSITGHMRDCTNPDCSSYEYAVHTGGDGSCSPQCADCGDNYLDVEGQHRNLSPWLFLNDEQHIRECLDCGGTKNEYGAHTGGTATCTEQAVCAVCATPYGELQGHIPGDEADCTKNQLCTREGCGEVLTKKLGHDYEAVVTEPTCTKQGFTTYACTRCDYSYKGKRTGALLHWYALWNPNPDGTHSAECMRSGCDHVGTTECTLFEITVKDGETETILTVCPICGDHGEMPFEAILEASIKAVDRYALYRGEHIVRGMDAPFDGVLYAFTAAYEYSGKIEPFRGIVSFTLPLDAEKYTEFKLVRVDVTPATETTERTEVWTDVDFTYEDGKLTFETDTAGLFLLLPVE